MMTKAEAFILAAILVGRERATNKARQLYDRPPTDEERVREILKAVGYSRTLAPEYADNPTLQTLNQALSDSESWEDWVRTIEQERADFRAALRKGIPFKPPGRRKVVTLH